MSCNAEYGCCMYMFAPVEKERPCRLFLNQKSKINQSNQSQGPREHRNEKLEAF